jgi:DNA-binding LacI/PurR family transcriptional regulator
MVKAAAILRDEGLLWYGQGKRMMIAGMAKEAANGSSVAIVSRFIDEKIRAGLFKSGRRLPKMHYFISECGVTRITVREALMLLQKQNLTHRDGKRWFAGPARQAVPWQGRLLSDSTDRPTVVLVLPHYPSHYYYFNDRWFRGLFCSLVKELDVIGVSTLSAFREDSPASVAFPSGLRQVRSLIKAMGQRYAGCILARHAARFPDIDEWAQFLGAYQKPVAVHNDIEDMTGLPSRLPAPCFRVYVNTHRAAVNAVEVLHGLGHRRIALVEDQIVSGSPWMKSRQEVIQRTAQSFRDGTTVDRVTMELPDISKYSPNELERYHGDILFGEIRQLQAAAGLSSTIRHKVMRKIKQHLAGRMPSIESFVKHREHTAIIAANDAVAAELFFWLRCTGIKVPGDYSIVSFDNNPQFELLGISTFDFGMENLGYLTAHRLIKDIPVKVNANGNIASMPRLIDRGSLAPPKKPFRRFDPSAKLRDPKLSAAQAQCGGQKRA